MDLPQLQAFVRYWEKAPPVHELFAAFAGYKAPVATIEAAHPADNSAQLLADLAASGIALPPEVLQEMERQAAGPQAVPRDGELPG